MLTTYERRLVPSYFTNALRHLDRRTYETNAFFKWFLENSDVLRAGNSLVELCNDLYDGSPDDAPRRRHPDRSSAESGHGYGCSGRQLDALYDRFVNSLRGVARRGPGRIG